MNRSRRSRLVGYGVFVIFYVLLAASGLAYWQIGEYLVRRDLLLTGQDPAIVAKVNDGVICPGCSETGLTIIILSGFLLVTTLIICGAAEIVITAKERAALDR